ncbi:MAG TPA: hypothetical protein PLX23_03865 [Candidatus Hydrogenedens sp.]|nr:hypothetical protein [Candidatus Hydrogenedens sp.]
MSEPKETELRIYCICGQKMRVQADMYGKPGRCVACRQKIRIPNKDEIPQGVTEIYLKDHPEYLRKKSTREKKETPSDSSAEEIEQVLSDFGSPYSLPLEPLKFLQILISAEYKAQKYLQSIRHKKPLGMETKTDLLGILSRIRRMRANLDDKIKMRLTEILEQSKQIEQEIGKMVVSFRTGDIDFAHYWKTVILLRIRRERLACRRKNLEGWLSVVSPELAGGYIDVDFSELPEKVPDIVFPLEEEGETSVLAILIKGLQEVISVREDVEHQLSEWKRVIETGKVNPEAGERGLTECEARLKIIISAISFYRERLEQLVLDCDLDLESIEKNINRIDKQKEAHIIDTQTASRLEEELFQARLDLSRTKDTARRAISANSHLDIPSLHGTFVARIGPNRGAVEIGTDSWIAWFCSALLIMLIMVPMTQTQGLVSSKTLMIMVTSLFISAILLALVGSIPYRTWRGIGLTVLWTAYVIFYTVSLNLTWYSLTPYGGVLRLSPYGFFSFGVISGYVVLALIGVAVWVSLYKGDYLWIAWITTIANIFLVIAILSNFFGTVQGEAALGAVGRMNYVPSSGKYQVEVSIHNRGIYSVWLGNNLNYVPAPVFVSVFPEGNERQLIDPYEVKTGEKASEPFQSVFNKEGGKIGPGETMTLYYQLPPGAYIVKLEGKGKYYEAKQIRLVLPEQKKENTTKNQNAGTKSETENKTEGEDKGNNEVNQTQKENKKFEEIENIDKITSTPLKEGEFLIFFHGFGNVHDEAEGNTTTPKFRITLRSPDDKVLERFINLGEIIVDDWVLAEFSPQRETITLKYREEIYIAQRGKYYKLKVESPLPTSKITNSNDRISIKK